MQVGKRVALLFGGKSAEHDVSLMSARYVFKALKEAGYAVTPVGVGRDGWWRLCREGGGLPAAVPESGGEITLAPGRGGQFFALGGGTQPALEVDVVFPVLHGPFGEDGTVQGLLEVADLPYVGAGVLGSAAAMDKDVAKRLLREAGLPIPRFIACHAADRPSFAEATARLGTPLFVKPARLGSSVGVSKATDAKSFETAVALALRFDDKILIEEFIDAREIECAVLEGKDGLIASVTGEIVPAMEQHGFYSYAAKYLDAGGARLDLPAQLPAETEAEVRRLALRCFEVLCCEGMARVDFFLQKGTGKVLVNEANTIPGFTAISMYPKLMEASGVAGPALVDQLVQAAVARWQRRGQLSSSRM